jgi:two-component system, OmpR family, sensor kinase
MSRLGAAASAVVPRTLRVRLITGLVALLALACATIGLVTYFAVANSLSNNLKSSLQTATNVAYNCWENQYRAAQSPPDNDGAPGTNGPDGGGQGSPADNGSAAAGQSGSDGSPATEPSATASPAPAPSKNPSQFKLNCPGLDERDFAAVQWHGQWICVLIGNSTCTLSAADQKKLLAIPPYPATSSPTGTGTIIGNAPSSPIYLDLAQGMYLVTSIRDPDKDHSIHITALPMSSLHDTLRDVAIVEAIVFSAVLLAVGVLGTFFVRSSLRPLRRVAATASRVAELPLESGEVELPSGVPDNDPRTETGQVGLAFNRMLGHVATALRRREASEARLRRFAADASHELRTPLAAIRGYAELGLLHPGESPEAVTHALGRVLSESTRMSVLVDDLLLLARLDAGRPLSREPVDITRLAIDVTSDAQVARPGHRWILELPDDSVSVLGDEHRLHQVLANLLSNAARHTPDGTTVTVGVGERLPRGEPGTGEESVMRGTLPAQPWVVVTVTDDGPGIPSALLPDLFERFTRADTSRSHATNASSTGLGLAIVDAVVAAHHGAVLVTSRPGMTSFTLVLAQLAEPASAPEQPQRRPRAGGKTPDRA